MNKFTIDYFFKVKFAITCFAAWLSTSPLTDDAISEGPNPLQTDPYAPLINGIRTPGADAAC